MDQINRITVQKEQKLRRIGEELVSAVSKEPSGVSPTIKMVIGRALLQAVHGALRMRSSRRAGPNALFTS